MTATNIETPAARATDAQSSHLAALEVTASGKRQTHIQQLEKVLTTYTDGLTSAEVAHIVVAAHPDLNRHECARRLADGMGTSFQNVMPGEPLTADGKPIRNMRECRVTTRKCLIWYPTEKTLKKYGKWEAA